MNEKKMAPTQIPVEEHEWLRDEAHFRRTSITAELTEAVRLLRQVRTQGTITTGQHTTAAVAQ